MKIRDINAASRLLEEKRTLHNLKEEAASRNVDFVENDRRRSFGRNQMNQDWIDDLCGTMKDAGLDWFDQKIAEKDAELRELGVDMDGD